MLSCFFLYPERSEGSLSRDGLSTRRETLVLRDSRCNRGSSLPLGIKRHLPQVLQKALRRRLIKTGKDLLQFFVAEVVVHSFAEYLPEIRSHGQVAPFVELL